MSNKDRLLNTRFSKVGSVTVNGESYGIKMLSAKDAVAFSDYASGDVEPTKIMAMLVRMTLIDADRNQIFAQEDEPVIETLDINVLKTVFESCANHNGLSEKSAKAIEGN